ncbi:MAG TPA: HPF/RaiA family ribosome-associated protein [Candidatus Saccharimonadales bacterium]|nr:HPF/RaiA family ribosome-associated protein [Candidatus Saccharimonadales bacterium]
MKTTISERGFSESNKELHKYARHKLAEVNRRLPRAIRPAVVCTVKFTQKRKKEGGFKVCTISLELPKEILRAEESTEHLFTSLDIVIVRLQQQVAEYKVRHRRRRLPRLRAISDV